MKSVFRYTVGLTGLLGILLLAIGCGSSTEKNPQKDLADRLLLKDWMPRSIHKVPEHNLEKAKYPVIDLHTHDYEAAREEVKKRIQIMNQAGIEKAMIFTEATGARFDSIYAVYSEYPERFDVYCGIDYTGYKEEGWSSKAVAELKRLHEIGCDGLGELGDKGRGMVYSHPTKAIGMHPDDPRLDPVFEAAGELGMPVNIHVTDPIWMYEPMDSTNDGLMRSYTWRIRNKDKRVGHNGLIKMLERTVQKHPNTTFVAAHLANLSYDLSRIGAMLEKYENLYADIGARFAEFSTTPRAAADFFRRHQDKIVYGTDYGWETFNNNTDYGNSTTTLEMYRTTFRILETEDDHFYLTDLMGYKWPLYGLGLKDDVLKNIYRENALKIIGEQ